MKKILFLLLFISLVLPAMANNSVRWYVGLHGNKSDSKMWDKKDLFYDDTLERIDNGNTKANSFSITAGLEITDKVFYTDNFKILFCGELFLDYINKTLVQGDKPMKWGSNNDLFPPWFLPRPMANKPIFKNKYLVGVRGKLGVRLFELVDIYGHLGLAYWERDWYLDRARVYNKFYEDPNWKILPIYGLGSTIHITDNWAVNINYTIIRQTVDIGVDRNRDSYHYNQPEIGINILTVGVMYYF